MNRIRRFPTILCAEPNQNRRALLDFLLSRAGYAVQFSRDGREAFDRFISDPTLFDLVIANHEMPCLDGIALVRRMHQVAFPGKIIIIASHLNVCERSLYREFSVTTILTEPLEIWEIVNVIQSVYTALERT